MAQWVVRRADGVFLRGGSVLIAGVDPASEDLVTVDDTFVVHPLLHRWDAAAGAPRALTQAEVDADEGERRAAILDSPAGAVSRALARATWEQLPAGKPTWLVFSARVRALVQQLT